LKKKPPTALSIVALRSNFKTLERPYLRPSPEERPEGPSALSRCAGFKNGGQKQQEDGLKVNKAVEEKSFNCLVIPYFQEKVKKLRASLFIIEIYFPISMFKEFDSITPSKTCSSVGISDISSLLKNSVTCFAIQLRDLFSYTAFKV
jgi:hypothetical protein